MGNLRIFPDKYIQIPLKSGGTEISFGEIHILKQKGGGLDDFYPRTS